MSLLDRVTERIVPKMLFVNGMPDKKSNIVIVPKDLSEMEFGNASLHPLHVMSGILVVCTRVVFRMKGEDNLIIFLYEIFFTHKIKNRIFCTKIFLV